MPRSALEGLLLHDFVICVDLDIAYDGMVGVLTLVACVSSCAWTCREALSRLRVRVRHNR